MIAGIPDEVLCVLAMFYGYGTFALITGKALSRWTGKIVSGTGPRIGGVTNIAIGAVFTWFVFHLERGTEVVVMLMALIITSAWLQHRVAQHEEDRQGWYRIPLGRTPRRKRKRGRWE
jgi:hypothetical protein